MNSHSIRLKRLTVSERRYKSSFSVQTLKNNQSFSRGGGGGGGEGSFSYQKKTVTSVPIS